MRGWLGRRKRDGGGAQRTWRLTLLGYTSLFLLLPWTSATAAELPAVRAGGGSTTSDPLLERCPIGEVRVDRSGTAIREQVRAPRKEAWERAHGGKQGLAQALRARLVGWPERRPEAISLPSEAREFARALARDTWRGLYAMRDREHALPIDHVRWAGPLYGLEGVKIGDYASSTNIGLFLASVVAARELGLISREEAVRLAREVLDTLDKLEKRRGFLFNYYDTTSLERTSNLLSFVDSSWFTAALVVLRNALPELRARANQWIEGADYGFFYDPARQQMRHGYYVHTGTFSPFHYGMWFTEARLGSLLAIGKGDVPRRHWFAMVRTYPPGCRWQRQTPSEARVERRNGQPVYLGYYRWQEMFYVPSWGGSMFEALMPLLFLDELTYAPHGLGANARVHVAVQQRYSREVLGHAVWGQSPSWDPNRDDYREYGIPVLGARGYEPGAVTPHAAALALLVDPAAALADLQELARRYPLYADFGFFDSVDPQSGQVASGYLFLDQAMTFLALANFLTEGAIQRYFAADPIVQAALPLLREDELFRSVQSLDANVAHQ
jgi:hypothetical protein